MSLVTHQFLVSFQEQAQLVQSMMYRHPAPSKLGFTIAHANYNATPYLAELCRVLFSVPSNDKDNRVDYDLITAEGILIRDGMDQKVVKNLTTMIFNQCIDILSEIVPHVAFNPEMDVLYRVLNEFDIMITVSTEFDPLQDAMNRGV
ncbi:MAG: hypothetical protein P4L77_11085 [Sulfuriferula sp.]|nr:hypothetical protein [Sulfuriferula sp.]